MNAMKTEHVVVDATERFTRRLGEKNEPLTALGKGALASVACIDDWCHDDKERLEYMEVIDGMQKDSSTPRELLNEVKRIVRSSQSQDLPAAYILDSVMECITTYWE